MAMTLQKVLSDRLRHGNYCFAVNKVITESLSERVNYRSGVSGSHFQRRGHLSAHPPRPLTLGLAVRVHAVLSAVLIQLSKSQI